jgi:hypothetical protein
MKKFLVILFLLNVLTSVAVFSQSEELGTENGPDPGAVPVDGGLSLLLAAGAAYGGRRLLTRDRSTKS